MSERPLIIGNWKMHGDRAFATSHLSTLVEGWKEGCADMAVLLPYPYLALAENALKDSNILWGAQNVHDQKEGAYTGEVSVDMLRDLGCRYVLVGHSERRHGLSEDDGWIAAKYKAAREGGLVPVLCVGETLAQREAGQAESVVLGQLTAVFEGNADWVNGAVVAYEPVWAIGTGLVANVDQVGAMHRCIQEGLEKWDATLACHAKILYGGSVKPSNAADLLAVECVDGALIGGASLDAASFLEIASLCIPLSY